MTDGKEEKSGETGDAYVIASVDRAAQLLIKLAEMPGSGVTELAEATGTTKSLTFRLLYTLERRGFVRKDAERRIYSLGYRAMFMGDQARRQSPLIGTAEPVLADLAKRTQENALLLVRQGQDSVCIALRESPQPLRIFAAVGRLGPLHAGGGPKVLLAHAPTDVRDAVLGGPLVAYTGKTVVSAEELRESLERIRQAGFALSSGEIDPNTFSIAAPVRDQSGEVIASLSVNGPTARLDDATQEACRDAVLENAMTLSRMLGWFGEQYAVSG
ncbi:MAG: IclR family transcriptional regulator [Pseudomonadota bacterium]